MIGSTGAMAPAVQLGVIKPHGAIKHWPRRSRILICRGRTRIVLEGSGASNPYGFEGPRTVWSVWVIKANLTHLGGRIWGV